MEKCEGEVDTKMMKEIKTQITNLECDYNTLRQKMENIEGAINNIKGRLDNKISSELERTTSETNLKIKALESKLKSKISSGLQSVSSQFNRLECDVAARIYEAVKPAFITTATKYLRVGCSGTIQLPSKGESILLDFNLAPTSTAAQRYLWTMDATQNNKWIPFKVKLTLMCKHPTQILDDNTLAFTEWGSNKQTATNMISSQNAIILSNSHITRGFLSFNAKKIDSEAGFILRVDVLHTDVYLDISSSSSTHTESVGRAAYRIPSSHDVSSIVINPQPAAKITLKADVDSSGNSDPCQGFDSVDILEFKMDGTPRKLGRLCGRQSAISFKTENPVVALFWWLERRSGRGVKLSWK